jgi:hypothetical protein
LAFFFVRDGLLLHGQGDVVEESGLLVLSRPACECDSQDLFNGQNRLGMTLKRGHVAMSGASFVTRELREVWGEQCLS